MTVAVADTYKLIVRMTAGYGDDLDLVFHYTPNVLYVGSDPLQAVIDTFEGTALVPLSQVVSNVITFDKLQSRTLTLPVQGKEKLISLTGALTGDPLPQQIATQVLWNTDFLGKRYRGHNKLPYPNEAALTAGIWTSGHLTACANVATALTTLYDVGTGLIPQFDLIVFSQANQAGELVTSSAITRDPRSQLSRTIARGS